jgi:hypothetical protein
MITAEIEANNAKVQELANRFATRDFKYFDA